VIVPQIRGGATVMDDVFGDSDDEDTGDYNKESKSPLGSSALIIEYRSGK
jgi:hypothetical protein